MPDNRLRVRGEKLARAMDEFIAKEFPEPAEGLQVRRAVADYFRTASATAERPRRPFPATTPADDQPGDWN